MNLEQQVLEKLAEIFNVDPASLDLDSTADSVDRWDSMAAMLIIIWLQNDYGISLEPGATGKIQSVTDILDLIREHNRES